ncbi:MAG TPA: MFS transporter [Stellaceae bacterium]|jgi:predicted MFS family arabinose efflux permease|nr:MFS transporter [Stellaceae bacterium]
MDGRALSPNSGGSVTGPRSCLAVGWITLFAIGTDLFVVSPLLPAIAGEFQLSAASAGLCATVFCVAYMITAPMLGALSDRVGRRPTLVASLVGFGIANLLTGTAADFASLLIFRVAAGATSAGIAPLVYAGVGEAAPPERRATWMALAVSGLLLALSLGAPLGTLASEAWGWRAPFIVLAACSLVLALANRLVWPKVAVSHQAAIGSAAIDLGTLARRLAPTVLWATGLYGVYTYLGVGLTEAGFSPSQIARSISVYGVGALVGTLLGGQVADRFGVFLTMRVSLIGLVVGLLTLGAALGSERMLDLALVASSILAQLFFPAQQSGLAHDFPGRRATMLAWNNSALFLGISLGALIGGATVEWIGFAAATAVCAGIVGAALIATATAAPLRPHVTQKTAKPRVI